MRSWSICAAALMACNGSGSSSGSSGSSGSASGGPPAPAPPPKVALVRCAPAPVLPFEPGGILGNAALQQGGAFASLVGTGDISSGFDDKDIYGGLLGNDPGDKAGGFGFGRSGFGPGGGGTGWGTIGTGRYGTIGHGSGRGGMPSRAAAVPSVRIGQPNAAGDLDKAIIRRFIKRNLDKIQYCYEKQLLAKPKLAGTLTAQFFITPNGTVENSSAQGVDPDVASCVADVIRDIEFPKPKGGGGVQVNYPFTFRPSDDGSAPTTAPPDPAVPPDPSPAPAAPAPAPAPPPDAWTPFARASFDASDDVAGVVSVAVQGAVQSRLAAIDTCFGATPGGSLRAMILVGEGGAVGGVRAGGLGTPAVERCVAQALAPIHVTTIDHPPIEIACDLSRGPEQPWRVSPDDFDRIDVAHGAAPGRPSGDRDLLIVAAPDATGADLRAAALPASLEHATVFALAQKAGPPRYLGISAGGSEPTGAPDRARLELVFRADHVEACLPGVAPRTQATPRGAELDRAFAALAAACKGGRCSDAVAVDDAELADAGTLAAVLDRARALGFTRVVIGGPMTGCAP